MGCGKEVQCGVWQHYVGLLTNVAAAFKTAAGVTVFICIIYITVYIVHNGVYHV